MKYTALSVHLFAGASEKDTEAATTTKRVEGTQRRRYRCRAITPLLYIYIRRAFATRRAAHFVNFAYQSSERKRETESGRAMRDTGR